MSADERNARIEALFPLVKRIARRVARMAPGAVYDDLVGDGCVGSIRAVDTFDPARGVPLEKYAPQVIAGAMLNGLRALDPVPERVRREIRDAEKERHRLAFERGSWPAQHELEARRPHLRRACSVVSRCTPLSLDAPLPPEEELAIDWNADPALLIGARARTNELHAFMRALPPREAHVIALHYYGERSLRNIGRSMKISPQRASQLHTSAVKRLRNAYGAH